MAETDAVIRISATGAEQASAAIGSVSQAMNSIGQSSDALKGKFQDRFQHIGLMLFAGDALRASGLGRETRMVVSTLNLALQEGAAIAGLSSGGILLLVAAFGALVGIIAKVIEHHKSLNESLQKINKANHDQLDSTYKTITSIQEYTKEVGYVPDFLKRWETSERNLLKAQVERQIQGDRAQVSSLTALMNQSRLRTEQLKSEIDDQNKLVEALKKSKVSQDAIIGQVAQLNKLKVEYDNQKLSVDQYKAKIDELIASIKLLSSNGTDSLDKLAAAHKKTREEVDKAAKEYEKNMLKEAEADTSRYQHWAELGEKQKKKHDEIYDHMKQTAIHTLDAINTEQSNAFAKMVVEGESFSKATAHLWRNIAEQVISEIERVIVKMMVLYAVEQMTGFGGFGGPSAATLAFVHPRATGGTSLVTQPTLFLAGEAGPEVASFTPLSKLNGGNNGNNSSMGGSGIQVGTVQTNVYGVQDPDSIADSVGRKIIERIRGMGELNFTRAA